MSKMTLALLQDIVKTGKKIQTYTDRGIIYESGLIEVLNEAGHHGEAWVAPIHDGESISWFAVSKFKREAGNAVKYDSLHKAKSAPFLYVFGPEQYREAAVKIRDLLDIKLLPVNLEVKITEIKNTQRRLGENTEGLQKMDSVHALMQSWGTPTLRADGPRVFLNRLYDLDLENRIAPSSLPEGVRRHISRYFSMLIEFKKTVWARNVMKMFNPAGTTIETGMVLCAAAREYDKTCEEFDEWMQPTIHVERRMQARGEAIYSRLEELAKYAEKRRAETYEKQAGTWPNFREVSPAGPMFPKSDK